MMETPHNELKAFLVRAKCATYASGREEDGTSRPHARDFRYQEETLAYIDSFVGGKAFAGEEIVYEKGIPVWGMNYQGRQMGVGFDGGFLRKALLQVPEQTPFRGPIEYQEGSFLYCNAYAGDIDWFFGREEIYASGVSVYECMYHGGFLSE